MQSISDTTERRLADGWFNGGNVVVFGVRLGLRVLVHHVDFRWAFCAWFVYDYAQSLGIAWDGPGFVSWALRR